MKIEKVYAYHYSIPLNHPFRISAGEIREKEGLVFELRTRHLTGWGEASVDGIPFYAHETCGSVMDLARRVLVPLLESRDWNDPYEFNEACHAYRGGNFAKCAFETALWDIYGQQENAPVWKLLGGNRETIESGGAVGIKRNPNETVQSIAALLAHGYRRIKLKISPGHDTEYLEAVRSAFPDISLMVDANSAYGADDFDKIASWDRFNLLMIEQPLDENDIYFHSLLRRKIKNPICLDESLHTIHDTECAINLKAADIVNIKVCRVGGLCNTKAIHDLCMKNNISNWIGSRITASIGEAPRLAACTLPNCSLASDFGIPLERGHIADDFAEIDTKTIDGCRMTAPSQSGLGLKIDRKKLSSFLLDACRM
ncbi:MAG: o-succinylbenzoate synthase [Lentisphaerae bacterium ADurb.Bin242]|nr:MAG: o-succinylbenzoate synthase [Lentisphaerae bacterium ADurb.Bin242]